MQNAEETKKYTVLSIREARKLFDDVKQAKHSRTIEGYQFPDNIRVPYNGLKFKNCRMHGVRFPFTSRIRCTDCDLTNANFKDTVIGGSYGLSLDNCILTNVRVDERTVIELKKYKQMLGKVIPMRCPSKGAYIAYKKCFIDDATADRLGLSRKYSTADRMGFPSNVAIVKLEIPASAKRSSGTGNKCRASAAKVIWVRSLDKQPGSNKPVFLNKAVSWWQSSFYYEKGKTVKPTTRFNPDRFNDCASGIHHFMTFQEAARFKF